MRFVANFVMRGRQNAIGACVFGLLMPLMLWLSTATLSLVVLRKGVGEGLLVLMWASLPLVVMAVVYEDPTPVLVLLGSLLASIALAYVLRETSSWQATLAIAVLISALGTLAFEFAATGLMAQLVDHYLSFLEAFQTHLGQQNGRAAEDAVALILPTGAEAHDSLFGSIATLFAYFTVVFLILARWWQSELYNPGGFGLEFRKLSLSQGLSTALVLGVILSLGFDGFVRWASLLTMPLVIVAIGLIHWIVKTKKLSVGALVSFYILMIIMPQLVAPVLITVALIDSWFDLRKRIRSE